MVMSTENSAGFSETIIRQSLSCLSLCFQCFIHNNNHDDEDDDDYVDDDDDENNNDNDAAAGNVCETILF